MSLVNIIKCLYYNAILLNLPYYLYKVFFSNIIISRAIKKEYGHFQCGSFISLFKYFYIVTSLQVALLIKDYILVKQLITECYFDFIKITGIGFLNVQYSISYINSYLNFLLSDRMLGIPLSNNKIVVDFSSPNIAKEMHVGHLRSTILGDCLANGLEEMGNTVFRVNHIGDWGTQFGILIFYLKCIYPELYHGDYRRLKKINLFRITRYYQEANENFTNCFFFKKKSREEVVLLQKDDLISAMIWKIICVVSKESYDNIYNLLNVKLYDKGESFYSYYIPFILTILKEKKLTFISKKATCVKVYLDTQMTYFTTIIKKADGGYNYMMTDLAALYYRLCVMLCSNIIYVTDASQRLHFDLLFTIAEKFLNLKKSHIVLKHIYFGSILDSLGKRIKTRSGSFITLKTVLIDSIRKARQLLFARNVYKTREDVLFYGKCLGVNILKYADLVGNRTSNYKFSYTKMLCFTGNTVVFILYSYVRIQSLKRKTDISIDFLIQNYTIYVKEIAEIELALQICQFSDKFNLYIERCMPSILTDYLYNLAEKFHFFFQFCRVYEDKEQYSRLLLCELVRLIIIKGFKVLGLSVFSRI